MAQDFSAPSTKKRAQIKLSVRIKKRINKCEPKTVIRTNNERKLVSEAAVL